MTALIIDSRSGVPVYEQIQEQIRSRVRDGTLPPGSPIPSVRQLAADLGINPNTVAKAYMLLERERIIQTASRRGAIVAEAAPDAARRLAQDQLDDALDRLLEQGEDLGLSAKELLQAMKQRIEKKPAARRSSRKEAR